MDVYFRQFHGPTDWGWVQKYVPMLRVEDTCGIMAIDAEKNETVGGVIVDNILNNSCQATIILKSSMVLRYGFLEECLDWIFNGLNKRYIYCLVATSNKASQKLCRKVGGVAQMQVKDGYRDGDHFVVYQIDREKCPIEYEPMIIKRA